MLCLERNERDDTMPTYYTYFDSPIQPLLLTSDGTALTGLFMVQHKYGPEAGADWQKTQDVAPFSEAACQLTEYFARQRTTFDLPLAPVGTAFQKRVWEALCRIPYGRTVSYGTLARQIGQPTASRAVGMANGRNPLSIIVPCHRVVGANGRLVGYGGGVSRKEALLALEGIQLLPNAVSTTASPSATMGYDLP